MRSLALKLTVAFWIVSLIGVILVVLFSIRATASELDRFIDRQDQEALAEEIGDAIAAGSSWETVAAELISSDLAGDITVLSDQGQVLLATDPQDANRRLPRDFNHNAVAVEANGRIVGYLLTDSYSPNLGRRTPGPNPREDFLATITRVTWLAAGGATAVSLVLGLVLARTLTQPIQELTNASQAIAQGDLTQRVSVRTDDELGRLATAFNQMSNDLAQSRDQRRQMTADIAHDLRTPLSLILGHAEALSDGVLPPTPETLSIIHDEAQRLNRLIEDLRTLSLADTGELSINKRPYSPATALQRTALAHAPAAQDKQVTIDTRAADSLPNVMADPDRLAQVLDNLLSNALRYTPRNGRIQLSATPVGDGRGGNAIQFAVQDSGPGIAKEDLPRVFNRFYRADKSRQRLEGGSGLGLAIARSIVEQHNGRIWVTSSPGQGTTFTFTIPVAQNL